MQLGSYTNVSLLRANDAPQQAAGGEATAAANTPKDFFGADGLTFGDVLDAINPLNHIPIVSDLVNGKEEQAASTFSKLAGGALLGGPVGFFASLASVIFEDATGQSPVAMVVAALTGEDAPTQLAENEVVPVEESPQVAQAETSPSNNQASLVLASLVPETQAALGQPKPMAMLPLAGASSADDDQAVLSLYGASAASAHSSYRKAQLLPYLNDVTASKVL